ncbi:MAG TPA: ABC transporter permease [bacterium]|nr:ABC transporter permease [bacterium]HOL47219.1 ABC transporter permease [bacterium]HPQ18272.1 ABC transporter permease [bacterium]
MEKDISFYLAKKYFFNKKKQGFIKIITIISIIGVIIGVIALIVVLGVMNGFDDYLKEKIISITSDISLYPNINDDYNSYKQISKDIEEIDGIKTISAVIQDNALLKVRNHSMGVVVYGIEEEKGILLTGLNKYIIKGQPDLSNDNSIIIGYYLALNENLHIGDEILLIPPNIISTPLGILPTFKKYRISGIFKSGMFEYDYRFIYINLRSAQKLFGKPDKITSIEIKVDKIEKVDYYKNELKKILLNKYYIETFKQKNANLFAALKLEKLAMFIVLSLIIAVASLNIASTLIVMVVQKVKDIGLFLSIGLSSKKISKIFVLYGVFIGVIGSIIGTFIGLIICYILSKYQLLKLPGDIYYIEYFPVKLNVFYIVLINVVAIGISIISTLIPAKRATYITPSEALRNE